MSRLTLRLPETLHQQLTHLAADEGVSLNQYIVYALTRQISSAYRVQAISAVDVKQQAQDFSKLLDKLGQASSEDIKSALDEREIVAPEEELTPDLITHLKQQIDYSTQSQAHS